MKNQSKTGSLAKLQSCIRLCACAAGIAAAALAETGPLTLRSVATGTLTYPVADNVDFREGTAEFWLQLALDPTPLVPSKDYQGFAAIVAMGGEGGGWNLHYCAPVGSAVPLLWCSIGPKTKLTPFGAQALLKYPEWHHVALTWKGPEMTLHLDGQKVSERKHNESPYVVFGEAGSQVIFWGDRWNVAGLMVVDDFRLSRVVRSPQELGFHGELKPDVYTSILDPFEGDFEPEGKTLTRPRVLLNGQGGLPSQQCRFIGGKFGKGLAFFEGK